MLVTTDGIIQRVTQAYFHCRYQAATQACHNVTIKLTFMNDSKVDPKLTPKHALNVASKPISKLRLQNDSNPKCVFKSIGGLLTNDHRS